MRTSHGGRRKNLYQKGYTMRTSEVLHTAADLIEKRGWITGTWGSADETSPLCLEGAILAALGEQHYSAIDTCPAGQAVRDYLGLTNDVGSRLYNWNDRTGDFRPEFRAGEAFNRTAEEVIEVLRAAAVIEAAKESAVAPESVPA